MLPIQKFYRSILTASASFLVCFVAFPVWAVSLVHIDVQQFNFTNNSIFDANPGIALSIPAGELSPNGTGLDPFIRGGNRGDYDISWNANGSDDSQDVLYGVMLSFARQNVSTFVDFGGVPMSNVVTTAAAVSGNDTFTVARYFLPVFSAGAGPQGEEWNANVAAAFFPFAEGWVTGSAYRADGANGQPLDLMNAGQFGPPGANIVNLGAVPGPGTFIDGTNGVHQLYLPNASIDTRADGLLFVTGAKNEDNYGLSNPSADGTHFVIRTHHNQTNGPNSEQDPVSFLYMPLDTEDGNGNPLAMGKIAGDGTSLLTSGSYTLTTTIAGIYELTIPDEDPTTGLLMVSPEGGGTTGNEDNIVTYAPNGSGGWQIQVRDVGQYPPPLESTGAEASFSFAFLPFDAPPVGPGPNPNFGTVAAVPEPSTMVLLGIAGVLIATRSIRRKLLPVLFLAIALMGSSSLAVEHAVIHVEELGLGNDPSEVNVTIAGGTPGFNLDPNSNRGDYNIAIANPGDTGFDRTNDHTLGILLSSPLQNASTSPFRLDEGGFQVYGVTTVGVQQRSGGGYYIAVFRAPAATEEWNSNVGAVYFPFEEGWYAGHAINESNGATLTIMNGPNGTGNQAPEIVLGTDFIDLGTPNAGQNGTYELTVPGVTDTRRQGILFVAGGKNEDNFGSSAPSTDGSKYSLYTKGNNTDGTSTERDPIAFAFIPMGTPGVTMGRVSGSGGVVARSGNFAVAPITSTSSGDDNIPDGIFRIDIPGQSPTTGTLIVSPENVGAGDTADNIVTAEPAGDGTGWIVHTRDLPGDPSPSLQGAFGSTSFSFAFFPNTGSATAPGAIMPVSSFQFDSTLSSVVGGNVTVVEHNPGNNTGDNSASISSGTAGIAVPFVNRGDISISQGGDFFREGDGVMFATVTQNQRNNSGTNGFDNPGVAATSIQNGSWMVHTATADGNAGLNGEHNINFAAVVFQANSGFQTKTNQVTVGGLLDVVPGTDITGVTDPTNEGVLMVGAYGNDDNYATVSVLTNQGTGDDFWAIDVRDNQGTLEQTAEADGVNYVWLPFNTPDLVAGRIAGNGSVIASTTDSGNPNFTLTRTSAGIYELYIPDKTPDDGMLLLNGELADPGMTGDGGSIMSYEAGVNGSNQDVFIIQSLNVNRQDQGGGVFNSIYTVADTEFSFAYIDFGVPDGLPGDHNGDGKVDAADYVLWRDNSSGFGGPQGYTDFVNNFGGMQNGAGSFTEAVPEPSGLILVSLVLASLVLFRRR